MNDVHALTNRSEDGVVAVEPWSGNGGEEKLRTTGVSSSVGHGENTRFVVLEGERRWLARNLPPWSTGARSAGHGVL